MDKPVFTHSPDAVLDALQWLAEGHTVTLGNVFHSALGAWRCIIVPYKGDIGTPSVGGTPQEALYNQLMERDIPWPPPDSDA